MAINKNLLLTVLPLLLSASGLGETASMLRDIHSSSRTYRFIHHRSQKKLRRLARQRR